MTFWARTCIHALYFPFIVYLFQITTIILFDVYSYFPDFDIPMHILGGVSVALGCSYLLQAAKKKRMILMHSYGLEGGLIVLATLAVAVCWEWYEYFITILAPIPFQGTVGDTMADLACGALGALITVLFLTKKPKKSRSA